MFPGQQPLPQGPGAPGAPGAPAPQPGPMPQGPGGPPMPGAQPGGDPAVKGALMQRVRTLQPQDISALNTIAPEAMQALSKLIPELTDLLKPDGQGADAGGQQPMSTPGDGGAPAPGPGGPQPGGQMPPRRPVTQLGQM